jgi:radical SAM protein with 4Fe4S-binding SPASM domain
MINFTRLLTGRRSSGDALRYERTDGRPIVVWNSTRRCNLRCGHCYAGAGPERDPGELTTAEAVKMIDDLAAYRVPVLLFSGGEPLLREDLFELGDLAKRRGLRTVISTNGTLIDAAAAKAIAGAGFDYVGVSIDGTGMYNDRFRGVEGAFARAVVGIRTLQAAGQKTGLRFTMTRDTIAALPEIFALVERERIGRVCFYHLVYTGRGRMADDLNHGQTRAALGLIRAWTLSLHERGMDTEVLTVDNHADGAYLYLAALRDDPERAGEILRLLAANGGNGSGKYIAAVDCRGEVHVDQFLQEHAFGSVRDRAFGDLWENPGTELLRQLKDRRTHLKGRCAKCRFVDVCNGNFRARAYAAYGDIWREDPACYLTDEEIR